MPTLGAPLLPVTSASPLVIVTASTLPAVNASMLGTYSNQTNSTSTPSCLNQPFWMPMSQATQPGQSLYPIFKAGPLGLFGATVTATAGAAGEAFSGAGASLFLHPSSKIESAKSKVTSRSQWRMGRPSFRADDRPFGVTAAFRRNVVCSRAPRWLLNSETDHGRFRHERETQRAQVRGFERRLA